MSRVEGVQRGTLAGTIPPGLTHRLLSEVAAARCALRNSRDAILTDPNAPLTRLSLPSDSPLP
jgi:glycine cleavage system regulatory protein